MLRKTFDIAKKSNFIDDATFNKLNNLTVTLNNTIYKYCAGPYPAKHDIEHIKIVIKNLITLITHAKFTENDYKDNIHQLLAAGLIHDAGMKDVGLQTDEEPQLARQKHASQERIRDKINNYLDDFHDKNTIIQLASAHAPDDTKTAEEKQNNFWNNQIYLKHYAILLQAADFFDLGPHRLIEQADSINWSEDQKKHYEKHDSLEIKLDYPLIKITPTGGSILKKSQRSIETAVLYEEVIEEAIRFANILKENRLGDWQVISNWEILGAKVVVRTEGSFKQLLDSETLMNIGEPIRIDLMGHSLYGRFCDDLDNINGQIKSFLRRGNTHLRIIILDPSYETQQMYETADTQGINSEKENNRCILPDYDNAGKIFNPKDKQGDILQSISKMKKWISDVENSGSSSIEVRTTRRVITASLNRFENKMLVTPYTSGLTSHSTESIVTLKGARLFENYQNMFEDIWKDEKKTDILLQEGVDNTPNLSANLQNHNNTSHLEYTTALSYHENRIKDWFLINDEPKGKTTPIPPFEVEIQTSSVCQLQCPHCIGSHLGHVNHFKNVTDENIFKSVFTYFYNDYYVERLRLSGLYGDPFASEQTKLLSCKLIKMVKSETLKNERKGKPIYISLYTNGLELGNKVQEAFRYLEDGDAIHISLDACNNDQYKQLKFIDLKKAKGVEFDEICKNINTLKNILNSKVTLGVGFVVTQANNENIHDAIKLAKKLDIDFIRFKPDLRPTSGIAWRSWQRAKKQIEKEKKQTENNIKIYLTNENWFLTAPGPARRCWNQFLNATICGDGLVYRCDHLAGRSKPIGDIKKSKFSGIWEKHWEKYKIQFEEKYESFNESRNEKCIVCPPFGAYINRKVERWRVQQK